MATMVGVIYGIKSKIKPKRLYIGSSVKYIKRKWTHRSLLKNNKHHSRKLQRHYGKYGANDLIFFIIETHKNITQSFLLEREQYYIDLYKPYFNCSMMAGCPVAVGEKQPQEIIEKRASKMRGVKRGAQSERHKRNRLESRLRGGRGNGLKGKPKPKDVCDKISNTLKGRQQPLRTAEHRKHLSEAMIGKKHTKEARLKMSKAKKGKSPWNKGLKMPQNKNK